MPPEISVVIPVCNEEGNIWPLMSSLCDAMKVTGRDYEVIFVNDGSTDGSRQILTEVSNSYGNVRVVDFTGNFGLTAALDAGFKAAMGKIVVTLDADLQNDPADIPLLLEGIKDFDMVCGWRYERHDPWLKRISSKVANFVRNRLSSEDVKDIACTLKAYRRECLDKIKLYDGLHRFLPTLFKLEGFSVTEVKVRHHPRRSGKSKYNIRNRVFKSFFDLMVVRWMKMRSLNYKIVGKDTHR